MNAILLFAQDNTIPNMMGGMLALMVIFWIIGIAATIFWLWMLVDALVNETRTEEKILWFLVIFFLHFLGAVIYFFVRRAGRRRALRHGPARTQPNGVGR